MEQHLQQTSKMTTLSKDLEQTQEAQTQQGLPVKYLDRAVILRDIVALLVEHGYLEGHCFLPPDRTSKGHGSCCYCTGCGHDHDSCVCDHNDLLEALSNLPTYPGHNPPSTTPLNTPPIDLTTLQEGELVRGLFSGDTYRVLKVDHEGQTAVGIRYVNITKPDEWMKVDDHVKIS